MSKSSILVIVQFSCITYFVFSGSVLSSNWLLLAIQVTGIAVGIWAIMVMKPMKVSVFPEPKPEAELLKSGPYQLIRHPMYTAILLTCFPIVVDRFAILDILVFCVLLVNQVIKLNYEERLLRAKFQDYEDYSKSTWRLIPFVY